jgi:hypothetical protein
LVGKGDRHGLGFDFSRPAGARQLQLDVSDSYNSRFCGRL